jgi:HSP20 family molecular chaperone IbpA
MNTSEAILVPVRTAETVFDGLKEMYDRITRRAFEIATERIGACTPDVEDWFTAERELLVKPDARVEEVGHLIVVTVCLGRVPPQDVQLLVSPEAMVIQADLNVASKKLFRTIEFPRRIDVTKEEAKYANGCLVVTA